jgi:two-component system cell cycle sensor histidine kinase/response regulator CckA
MDTPPQQHPALQKPIRILHHEDDLRDRELVAETLLGASLACEFVYAQTQGEFEEAVNHATLDLILSDFTLPSYGGMAALAAAQQSCPEIPFLFVSGTIGDERAVASLKCGATDYVLKDRLEQLAPAVRRALREAELRRSRQEAEEKLRQSENRYRILFNSGHDAVFVHESAGADGLPGRFIEVNDIACERLGYGREELLQMRPSDIDAPETSPNIPVLMTKLAAQKSAVWEGVHLTKSGERIAVEICSRVFELSGRKVHLSSVRDIRERKLAQAAVLAERDILRTLIDNLPDVIFTTDSEGRFRISNSAHLQLLGVREQQDVEGKSVFDFHPQPLAEGYHEDNLRVLRQGESIMNREELCPNVAGNKRWFLTTKVPLRDREGRVKGLVGIVRDITERRRLEEQLRQAQKMEAVGQLAGGVAHDFNNLLAIIRGNAELLLMDDSQLGGEAAGCLKQIVNASERAANLTRQLLIFSRKQAMQSQPLLLNELVANLAKMLNRVIREDIKLECDPAASLPFVQADPGMLEQVIMNLVVNACDAMPKGGHLSIATEQITPDEAQTRGLNGACPENLVCLRVSDTGTGISPEHLPHIFEPFFTTKEPGKGTGLGLATVYGIVKQHKGRVEVASRVGRGTTFEIFLPAIPPPQEQQTEVAAGADTRGGSETILLVEDDLAVRLITRRVLESFGYRVLETASAQEAMELWRQRAGEIALLLTDVVMPGGLSGRDLADQLRFEKPELTIIFMSGYSSELLGKDTDFFRRTNSCFLHKPCSKDILLHTVRLCLDRETRPR